MESNGIFDKLMNFSYSKDKEEPVEEKKLKPSEKLLLNIKKSGVIMDQLEPVLKTKGNQLIISCAGSGKTTALLYKVNYDIMTGEATKLNEVNGNVIRIPDRIWVCTFLKTGADELGAKMSLRQRELGIMDTSNFIQFSTLHAEFKRALNSMGVETNFIEEAENTRLLKKVLEVYNVKNDSGKSLNSEELRDFESALIYTRNRLDGKRYEKSIYDDCGVTFKMIEAILADWKAERKAKNLMDFEDMQDMLYQQCCVLKDEKVVEFIRNRFSFIYIDEFQDTSQIQYELLKIYISGCKKVVAIGDDDQTIYSWRGSYNGIITTDFKNDFNPTINILSYNFRCPSVILNAIVPSIERNQNRYKKDIKASRKGGLLRVGAFANYKSMIDQLGEFIYEDVSKGRSVAVLCRVNSDGLMPALLLDSMSKFSYTISGEGMTLDSYVGRLVLGIIRLFTDNYSKSVENSLGLLTWDKYSVQKLVKVCKNNKVSIWDLSLQDIAYSCPDIYRTLAEWRVYREKGGEIFALKRVLEFYRTRIFRKDNPFNRVCKTVISSMSTLLDYKDYDSVVDFLDDVEGINERLKARKKASYGTRVRIATVHEFKGKEADSVYIWNDSINVYPYSESRKDPEDYDEERRIHYIACTRAKKISTIMYIDGQMGDFVGEMDLSEAQDCSKKDLGGSLTSEMAEEDKNLAEVAKVIVEDKEKPVEVDGVDRDTIEYIQALNSEGKDIDEIYDEIEEMVNLGAMAEIVDKEIIKDIVEG